MVEIRESEVVCCDLCGGDISLLKNLSILGNISKPLIFDNGKIQLCCECSVAVLKELEENVSEEILKIVKLKHGV